MKDIKNPLENKKDLGEELPAITKKEGNARHAKSMSTC